MPLQSRLWRDKYQISNNKNQINSKSQTLKNTTTDKNTKLKYPGKN